MKVSVKHMPKNVRFVSVVVYRKKTCLAREDVKVCTNIKFDFQNRIWADRTTSITKHFEEKWYNKKGFKVGRQFLQ